MQRGDKNKLRVALFKKKYSASHFFKHKKGILSDRPLKEFLMRKMKNSAQKSNLEKTMLVI